jgi:hypothetical protein
MSVMWSAAASVNTERHYDEHALRPGEQGFLMITYRRKVFKILPRPLPRG